MATATASGASGTLGKGTLSMFNMPTATRPDFTTKATNCALLTITVICICILVLCGVMIVREYSLAKGYHASMCTISDVGYAPKSFDCRFCGPGPKSQTKEKGAGACKLSSFPCVQIKVTFTKGGKQYEGLLHPDSLQAASPYSKCSYSLCLKKPEDNAKAVDTYAEQWRNQGKKPFKCFVHTSDFEDVIVAKMHTMEDVVHSMLWPSCVIVICGIIFLKLEMKRRGIVPCPCLCTNKKQQELNNKDVEGATAGGGDSARESMLKCRSDLADSCRVECKLLRCSEDSPSMMSRSLSALDCLEQSKDNVRKNSALGYHKGRMGPSVSAEGLRYKVNSCDLGKLNIAPDHIGRPGSQGELTSNKKDGSLQGSQGSRVMGLETPV